MMKTAARLCIVVGLLGMTIMPTAIYGLFNMDSWAFHVSRVIFALK